MIEPEICILVPVWKRPEITKIFIQGIKNLAKVYKNLFVFFFLSMDDKTFTQNYCIIDTEIGFSFRYMPIFLDFNYPLGKKMNACLNEIRYYSFDYLMNLGSDDVLNPLIFDVYRPFFKKKSLYFGLKTSYFINFYTKKVKKSTLDLEKLIFGGGRMLHRSILEKMDFVLYPECQNQGLDTGSAILIEEKLGIVPEVVKTDVPLLLDIKTNTNINLWDILNNYPNICDVDIDIKKHFNIKI